MDVQHYGRYSHAFIIVSSNASYNMIAFIPSTILHFYGLLGAGYAMA